MINKNFVYVRFNLQVADFSQRSKVSGKMKKWIGTSTYDGQLTANKPYSNQGMKFLDTKEAKDKAKK